MKHLEDFAIIKISKRDREQALSRENHYAFPNATDPVAFEKYAEDLVNRLGYRLQKKKKRGRNHTMTTTPPLGETIFLASNWSEKTPSRRGATLFHECTHISQITKMGPALFTHRYIFPTSRWVLEMQAYHVNILAAHHMHLDTAGMPESIAKTMANKYGPWSGLGRKAVQEETLAICERMIEGLVKKRK
jgi:hypothetical protein